MADGGRQRKRFVDDRYASNVVPHSAKLNPQNQITTVPLVSTELSTLAEVDLWFLVPWARFPDCAPTCFSICRFALFLLPLPSLVPPPLVPWAAAQVAHPSIHHCTLANWFYLSTPTVVAWKVFTFFSDVYVFDCLSVCLSVFFPHDISKTDAARIIKLDTVMFRHESYESIYFGVVKRSKVKVTRHRKPCRRWSWRSCGCLLLLVSLASFHVFPSEGLESGLDFNDRMMHGRKGLYWGWEVSKSTKTYPWPVDSALNIDVRHFAWLPVSWFCCCW